VTSAVSIRRIRLVVGAVVCFLLPAASWLDGSSRFAWAMYSRAIDFRIDVVTFDADGRAQRRNPTALAERASPAAVSFLAGADHWRPGGSLATLRAHAGDLASYACREFGATALEVTIRERTEGRPERTTAEKIRCAP
jgi:hypothetical protein